MVYRTGPWPRAATQADQTGLAHTTYVLYNATYALSEPLFYPNTSGAIWRDLPTTNSTCTSAGGGGGCGLLASSSSSITALQHTHGKRDMRSGGRPTRKCNLRPLRSRCTGATQVTMYGTL